MTRDNVTVVEIEDKEIVTYSGSFPWSASACKLGSVSLATIVGMELKESYCFSYSSFASSSLLTTVVAPRFFSLAVDTSATSAMPARWHRGCNCRLDAGEI
jgi:hypothetical protein